MKIFTIGVSRKAAKDFFAFLLDAHIQKVLDIRLNNTSQLLGFSKGADLRYFCENCHDISYEHVPLFAPTRKILKKYRKDEDWPAYEKAFKGILKNRPIAEIFKNACKNTENICLLCSESSANKCHRRLVAEYLAKHLGLEIEHL
ncbi:MAG: hypothetical protein FD145_1502 [Candidatus Saganbacteria bacterium]|uniref:DUF488 domain-containing protein n=1 Tax=Candidatus Saganbacteria bacterium TaxID=2575572 RepID=A0A833KZR6_UNCSA|nr:MAG: hypothetical protein FD145_1502 [Candidatus Saganbacteria bacterium]